MECALARHCSSSGSELCASLWKKKHWNRPNWTFDDLWLPGLRPDFINPGTGGLQGRLPLQPWSRGGGGAPPTFLRGLIFSLSPVCLHSKANMVNQSYFPFLVKSFCYFVSLLQLVHDLKVTRLRLGKRQLLLLSLETTETCRCLVFARTLRILFIASNKKMFKKRSSNVRWGHVNMRSGRVASTTPSWGEGRGRILSSYPILLQQLEICRVGGYGGEVCCVWIWWP